MQNKLSDTKSTYLRQHADNPVNWYPWSAEAFEKAQAEDKPILLSIGYAACHWCHAMAQESFSDPKTAALINANFVPVKVDRQERPDVDAVYMNVCRALTGSGGWPLNLLLTPNKKPFFAGTYYPPTDRAGMIGFQTLLQNAAEAWSSRRQEVVDTASKITDVLNRTEEGLYAAPISFDAADNAADTLADEFDTLYGGFGEAPKFPMPHVLLFLLLYGKKYASAACRAMAEKTLAAMRDGGLHDHVGGGYFRYATDEKWLRPHYEKMLYDNALLAITFLEAGGAFTPCAAEIFSFLTENMLSPEGGFYSALSATTAAGEGAFYLWDAEEVRTVLGREAKNFCQAFHITKKSLPYGDDGAEWGTQLQALAHRRSLRERPAADKQILTGWNALAAVAFAEGYRHTGEEVYLQTAVSTVAFIDEKLRDTNGRLLARYFEGDAAVPAFSEDYAYLLWSYITLFEVTSNQTYLQRAQETWADVLRYFWDERGGAYFYANDAEQLIARPMDGADSATPSANAVLALCLTKLFAATKDENYMHDAEKLFFTFGAQVNAHPTAFCFMLYTKLRDE